MSLREPAVTTPSSPTAPDRRIDFGRMSRRAWIVTGMLVLFQIIAFADKAVLGLVSADAMPELGLTATEFGFIGSAFFFLYAIVSVVTGFLASKISVKWILALVVEGLPSQNIARRLDMSVKTVDVHRARIKSKTDADSISTLVRDILRFDVEVPTNP